MQEEAFFVQQLVLQLIQLHQDCQFILVFGNEIPADLPKKTNIIALTSGKIPTHKLSILHWYYFKLPSLLKKHNPSAILQPFGFYSANYKVPQVLLLQQLPSKLNNQVNSKPTLSLLKTINPKDLNKLAEVLTTSQYIKDIIIRKVKPFSPPINVVHGAAQQNFIPLGFNQQQLVKETYTQGHNYFFVIGNFKNSKQTTTVLKAFSVFKKWQQSNFKLVIMQDENLHNMETYKYKNDVVVISSLQINLPDLTGAAYACIYLCDDEKFGISILNSLQSGVPLICSSSNTNQEIVEEASLFFDNESFKSLAEQMIEIYKNEDLRSSLIEKGVKQANQFSWEKTANLVWESLVKYAK